MQGRSATSFVFGLLWALASAGSPLLAARQFAERPQGLGNYEHLATPRFVPAAQAHFMKTEDIVMGVSADGVAKAYQAPVVAWHHIVFDQLKTGPILVTW